MDKWDIWDEARTSSDTCFDCHYGHVVRDPYGTGDSPEMVECTASRPDECPDVWEYEKDLEKYHEY